jgi:hypothetical protein
VKTVYVDFSKEYYGSKKTCIPEKRSGKFVQIRHGDDEYLLFSPKELTPYHSDMVERFCRERKIEGMRKGGEKNFVIHDPDWVIAGGGKFEIDGVAKRLRLYDDSMAYGKFDKKNILEKILSLGRFSGYEVIVE